MYIRIYTRCHWAGRGRRRCPIANGESARVSPSHTVRSERRKHAVDPLAARDLGPLAPRRRRRSRSYWNAMAHGVLQFQAIERTTTVPPTTDQAVIGLPRQSVRPRAARRRFLSSRRGRPGQITPSKRTPAPAGLPTRRRRRRPQPRKRTGSDAGRQECAAQPPNRSSRSQAATVRPENAGKRPPLAAELGLLVPRGV